MSEEARLRESLVLLAHHGPVVSGRNLDTAVAAAEELEATARLFFLPKGSATRLLTADQVEDLQRAFLS
jgi:ribulose-5-phosphate 4-epimerase/fuculose-1-phosphate aldolase